MTLFASMAVPGLKIVESLLLGMKKAVETLFGTTLPGVDTVIAFVNTTAVRIDKASAVISLVTTFTYVAQSLWTIANALLALLYVAIGSWIGIMLAIGIGAGITYWLISTTQTRQTTLSLIGYMARFVIRNHWVISVVLDWLAFILQAKYGSAARYDGSMPESQSAAVPDYTDAINADRVGLAEAKLRGIAIKRSVEETNARLADARAAAHQEVLDASIAGLNFGWIDDIQVTPVY